MNDAYSEPMDFSDINEDNAPQERNLKPEHAEAINDIFKQLVKQNTKNEIDRFWHDLSARGSLTTIEQQQITADPRDVSPYKHIWSI